MAGLILAAMLVTACVPPNTGATPSTPGPSATATLMPGTCELVGARFVLPAGFTAQETREPREPLARVTINGDLPGRHHILLDIIPRAAADYGGDATPSALTKAYFDSVKASLGAKWTDVRQAEYAGPKRKYPALLSVEPVSGSVIPGQYDNIILLLFPDGLTRDGYFYSFFWTDIHLAADARAPVTELEKVVDGFVVLTSPVGAPSRGCG